ncbi:hypothetical protein SLEP1_g57629 [Rubroshorea leprosula]|uniref:Uncharacterized protein n=1 Tax=Rubroshorea leprosula TaxID=152421 RepID=A0AAV5MRD2_9ROSI|nr:hypothetical protein SLEP1_g57629 [Rubroshorea leprosula]
MSKTVRMCPYLQIGDGDGDDAQIAAKSRNSELTQLPPEFLICIWGLICSLANLASYQL